MSLNLHPNGFIETAGGCEGPRYVRSQPSRETGGILLNECEDKYVSQFKLPNRNIARYIKELESSWDKISDKDKELITKNLIKQLPMLKNKDLKILESSPTVLTFINDYVILDPKNNTIETLKALYDPSDTIKQSIPEDKRKLIREGVYDWASKQCLSFHTNSTTVFFVFVMCLLFFGLGYAICMQQIKKK